MPEKTRHITSNDGRARVAYEMALAMWRNSNVNHSPSLDDADNFLELVKKCTVSLAYRDG